MLSKDLEGREGEEEGRGRRKGGGEGKGRRGGGKGGGGKPDKISL